MEKIQWMRRDSSRSRRLKEDLEDEVDGE
jgi:hypothetical protein